MNPTSASTAATTSGSSGNVFLIATGINLLPYRDQERQAQRREAVMTLALAGTIAVFALFVARTMIVHASGNVAHLNGMLATELEDIDNRVGEIKSLEQEMQVLMARQSAIAVLQRERMQAPRLLAQVPELMPPTLYISTLEQSGSAVTLTGVAASNQDISSLLANMGRQTWVRHPQLLESRTQNADGVADARAARRTYYDFTVKFAYDEPKTADKAKHVAGGTRS